MDFASGQCWMWRDLYSKGEGMQDRTAVRVSVVPPDFVSLCSDH